MHQHQPRCSVHAGCQRCKWCTAAGATLCRCTWCSLVVQTVRWSTSAGRQVVSRCTWCRCIDHLQVAGRQVGQVQVVQMQRLDHRQLHSAELNGSVDDPRCPTFNCGRTTVVAAPLQTSGASRTTTLSSVENQMWSKQFSRSHERMQCVAPVFAS